MNNKEEIEKIESKFGMTFTPEGEKAIIALLNEKDQKISTSDTSKTVAIEEEYNQKLQDVLKSDIRISKEDTTGLWNRGEGTHMLTTFYLWLILFGVVGFALYMDFVINGCVLGIIGTC